MKIARFIVIVVIGSIALALIDSNVGVTKVMKDVPVWAKMKHKAVYFIWGGIIGKYWWK